MTGEDKKPEAAEKGWQREIKKLEVEQELRKSRVRVRVTYGAAAFLFLGGGVLIVIFILKKDTANAISLFNTILPVAAAIIAYWFAGRPNNPKKSGRWWGTKRRGYPITKDIGLNPQFAQCLPSLSCLIFYQIYPRN